MIKMSGLKVKGRVHIHQYSGAWKVLRVNWNDVSDLWSSW